MIMKITRTYKPTSLKYGQVEKVAEDVVRTVAGQTRVAHHKENECKPKGYAGSNCYYCAEPAMKKFRATGKFETFFSVFQIVAD